MFEKSMVFGLCLRHFFKGVCFMGCKYSRPFKKLGFPDPHICLKAVSQPRHTYEFKLNQFGQKYGRESLCLI